MRGAAYANLVALEHSGITPACAGSSTGLPSLSVCSGDHPRVCGEQNVCPAAIGTGPGSPPRVRGAALALSPSTAASRITPACAGSRLRDSNPSLRAAGSPPRVRGAGSGGNGRADEDGITPACAGSSLYLRQRNVYTQDHPRVCGEQLLANIF